MFLLCQGQHYSLTLSPPVPAYPYWLVAGQHCATGEAFQWVLPVKSCTNGAALLEVSPALLAELTTGSYRLNFYLQSDANNTDPSLASHCYSADRLMMLYPETGFFGA